jgi:hypothetical protein
MANIIEILFDVGIKIFGLSGEHSKARQTRTGAVASYLASIADNIENTSRELKLGKYPHGTCQIMLTHSEQMVPTIGDLITDKKAGQLADQLKEIWKIEQLYNELQSKSQTERERNLQVLDQAGGLFRATSEIIKASP